MSRGWGGLARKIGDARETNSTAELIPYDVPRRIAGGTDGPQHPPWNVHPRIRLDVRLSMATLLPFGEVRAGDLEWATPSGPGRSVVLHQRHHPTALASFTTMARR